VLVVISGAGVVIGMIELETGRVLVVTEPTGQFVTVGAQERIV
jgi:hypothetical protein